VATQAIFLARLKGVSMNADQTDKPSDQSTTSNPNSASNPNALAWRVTIIFALLMLLIEAGLFAYWRLLLQPRLRGEAQTQATVLAQSQAALLSEALSSEPAQLRSKAQAAVDQLLLLKTDAGATIFTGVALELDFDALNVSPELLQGMLEPLPAGAKGLISDVALYHHDSGELIGIAKVAVATRFFDRFSADVAKQLRVQALILGMSLVGIWLSLHFIIARHEQHRQRFANDLERARDAALAASRAKSQFLANMSHEIRTPMNAVLGMASLLRKTSLDQRQQALTGQLMDSARLLLGVLNDILDLSRIEAGKLPMQQVDFRLADRLSELETLLLARAQEKSLRLNFSIHADVPDALVGDPMRLQQVLVNLVSNAIKFTEQGSITVSISLLVREARSCQLQIAVQDTGIGIRAEDAARLFEAFTQVDESDTRKHGGAGLGLAICQRLVELMGGTIHCESTLGVGSTFYFNARFGCSHLALRQRTEQGAGLRALVVDDHPSARESLGSMLEDLRFDVVLSDSGENALLRMAREAFDVLLIDWRLPGIDGLEAVRQLRQRRLQPSARRAGIVLVSAYSESKLQQEAIAAGVDVCLSKPIDAETLFGAVMEALSIAGSETVGRQDLSACNLSLLNPTEAAASHTPMGKLAGRILVVEDHPINREIALAILQEMGLTVCTVDSGRAALDTLQAAPDGFDLVLMDVQMPELDGVATTALIKANAKLAHLPIVALTAHAMSGDREGFLAAGMDDYLSKPLEEAALESVLRRFLKAGDTSLPKAPEQLDLSEHAQELQRWRDAGVDVETALHRLGGKISLLRNLLHEFCKRHADASELMQADIVAKRFSAAANLAHAMRGAAGALAMAGVAQAASALEQALRQEQEAPSALADLRAHLRQFCASLKVSTTPEVSLLSQNVLPMQHMHNTAPPAAASFASFQTKLANLRLALIANDLAANKYVQDVAELLPQTLQAQLPTLQSAMDCLDYPAALRLIDVWQSQYSREQEHLVSLLTAKENAL
jgi:signal transduction histidine kinase/CheY-like chemotaxis protein